jgi:hypothetical protein
MKVLIATAVLVASLALAGHFEVKAETGSELLSHCSAAENNHWERGLCASNIGIVVETLSALKNVSPESSPLANFCLADGVTEEHIVEVVTDWLRENPKYQYYDASILVMIAMSEAWPCRPLLPPAPTPPSDP